MKRKKTSLKDIAQELGVSQMTVSRAIHGKSGLTEALQQKILAVADRKGYRPSRSVKGFDDAGSSLTVGVVVPHFANTIFPEIIENIEAFLSANGYRILLCCSYNNPIKEFREISALLERKADGIIWSPSVVEDTQNIVRMIQKQRCPLVFLDRLIPGVCADAVVVNDRESMRNLTAHLIQRGHRTIGYLNARVESYVSQERLTGYREAMKQAGIACDPELILSVGSDLAAGRSGAAELLVRKPRPTAIACFNDPLALGAELELRTRGIAIPREIALTGFSGVIETELAVVPLTTAYQNAAELGKSAAQLLFSRMIAPGEKITPIRKELRTALLLRQSTQEFTSAQ